MEHVHAKQIETSVPPVDSPGPTPLYPEGYLIEQKNKETERIAAAVALRAVELE